MHTHKADHILFVIFYVHCNIMQHNCQLYLKGRNKCLSDEALSHEKEVEVHLASKKTEQYVRFTLWGKASTGTANIA